MTDHNHQIPVFSCSFAEPDFLQDPYPVYERMRQAGPVLYNDIVDRYMVTSFRHASKVLGNTSQFNSHKSFALNQKFFGGVTMGLLDGEPHRQVRGVWADAFTRDKVEDHRRLIAAIVDRRLRPFSERLRSGESVDAVGSLTRDIPVRVIMSLMNLDEQMLDPFTVWSDAMSKIGDGEFDTGERGQLLVETGTRAARELFSYIASEIDDRTHPGALDLFTMMASAPYAVQSMARRDVIAANTQLVFAGNDTSAKFIAIAIVALCAHPDQRRAVVADRDLVPRAIEEAHRWQTIAQTMPRYACSPDSNIDGYPIPEGAAVMPLQGAANRDPQRWEHPESFDVFREPKSHLGFGFGPHSCLGLNLARLEVEILINRLLDDLPDYELENVAYSEAFALRGPSEVLLRAGA